MKKANKRILVIGTGELGLAMIKSIYSYMPKSDEKIEIGILDLPERLQDEEFKKQVNFSNTFLEPANLREESIERLSEIFKNYGTVICCSGFSIGAGMQIKITKAALEANVHRYIPWQFGVDYDKIGRNSAQPVFDEQLDVRDLLRNQEKTNWIIISTGMITSFLFREDFGVVNLSEKIVHALGNWQNSLTLTTCEDIGELTVAILFHQPELLNEVVFVSGETLSFEQIANIVEHFFDEKFERVLWSPEYLREALLNDPENNLKRYRIVFTHPGVTWPMAKTFNVKNNIDTTSVKQWLKENNEIKLLP